MWLGVSGRVLKGSVIIHQLPWQYMHHIMVVSLATFHLIVAYRIISSVSVKKNELCPLLMKSGLNFLCFSPTHTTRARLHLECLDKELGPLLDNLFSQFQNYKMHIYLHYNFKYHNLEGWLTASSNLGKGQPLWSFNIDSVLLVIWVCSGLFT
jgi:hypothetical protein